MNSSEQAIREGAEAVVAVGGDGTLHEVLVTPLRLLVLFKKPRNIG